jgi:hypothetical protein
VIKTVLRSAGLDEGGLRYSNPIFRHYMFILRSIGLTARASRIVTFPSVRAPRAFVTTMPANRDPNTLSNYNEVRTTHVSFNFDIDFSKKRLAGNVILKMKSLAEPGCKEVVLDTR